MRIRPIRLALGALALHAIALAAPLASPLRAQRPQGDPRGHAADVARIDSIVKDALTRGPVAAMSVAVVRGRDTIVMKGYGLADLENDVPATARTVYRIGSVTKQFTSAAIMQLVESGTIALDDDVTKYVPNAPVHGRHITVRHLLNHTSGIPSYTDVGRFGDVVREDLTRDSLVAMVSHDSLMFEPGSHFYYNNTGYFLLGMILEKVTGKKYGDYLQEKLFAPLGLTQTVYCSEEPIIRHRANGYELDRERQLRNAEFLSMELPFAAGSLCSTVRDLVKWTDALAHGRVVSPQSYATMTTPISLTSGRPMSYGFGLGAGTLGSHRVIQHGGGINGFISQLAYYPDDSLTVVVLANTAPAPSDRVATEIARALLGVPAPSGTQTVLYTTKEERARYLGEYAVVQPDGSKVRVRIVEDGDTLQLRQMGQNALTLLKQGDATFGVREMPGVRVVFDIEDGKAVGFQLARGARPLEATRVQ
jgi:D-alanyl-D-alanine carboxypeptidase